MAHISESGRVPPDRCLSRQVGPRRGTRQRGQRRSAEFPHRYTLGAPRALVISYRCLRISGSVIL
jgi:hypothetical protein